MLRCIGKGSYGEVWLARGVTGALRAVKVVRREDFELERTFEREFEGIVKFEPLSRNHPGVVHILHVGRNDEEGFYYYVMELADDREHGACVNPADYEPRTMGTDRATRQRLSVEECLEHGEQLAEGLAHLHSQGLTHRDIKPSNIIFVNGKAKLADIGLVAEAGQMTFVGTEGFVPPEGPGSKLADIYGLGMVLYEMSTGKDRMQFPELPDDLGETRLRPQFRALNQVILTACANHPKQRFQSAREMAEALRDVRAKRPFRTRRKTRQKWAAAGVMALALLAALVLSLDRRGENGAPASRPSGPGNTAASTPAPVQPQPPPPAPQPAIPVVPPTTYRGTVFLSSVPENAEVYYLGKFIGYTPLTYTYAYPGEMQEFELRMQRYKTQKVTVSIEAGRRTEVPAVVLQPVNPAAPPQPGREWKNSLGMMFDPLPNDEGHISRWAVDFNAVMTVMESSRPQGGSVEQEITPTGAVIYIYRMTPDDAERFCDLLTEAEIAEGWLSPDLCYRPELYDFKGEMSEAEKSDATRKNNIYFKCVVQKAGSLSIKSTPPGAAVYEGSRFLGYTPVPPYGKEPDRLVIRKYRPGELNFRLSLVGYQDYFVTKELRPGETLAVDAVMEKSPLAVFGKDWENSLGMKFKPVVPDGVFVQDSFLMSAWETRVQDYAVYAHEKGVPLRMPKDFQQDATHPVVNVTREEARAFCRWLTERERGLGFLDSGMEYRLPTDAEWSLAAGMPDQNLANRTPESRRQNMIRNVFPWRGSIQWPPFPRAGNFGDIAALGAKVLTGAGEDTTRRIQETGYNDQMPCTAPVGSFEPNNIGIYDLSGNVWEIVQDDYGGVFPEEARYWSVLRGGSWSTPVSSREELSTHFRRAIPNDKYNDDIGFRVVVAPVMASPAPVPPVATSTTTTRMETPSPSTPAPLAPAAPDEFVGPPLPPGYVAPPPPPPVKDPEPMPDNFNFTEALR